MRTIAVEDTSLTAEDLAAMAQQEVVILTRKGNPLVCVTKLRGSDWESVSLASNPKFIELIENSRRSYRKHGGISLGQIRHSLGLKPARKPAAKRRRGKSTG
jgi:hypothetical protein